MTRQSVCSAALLIAASVAATSRGHAQTFKAEKWNIGGEGGTDYLKIGRAHV